MTEDEFIRVENQAILEMTPSELEQYADAELICDECKQGFEALDKRLWHEN